MMRWLALLLLSAAFASNATAVPGEGDISLQGQYWIDESAKAGIQDVAERGAATLKPMERRPFQLGTGAMWLRFDIPSLDPAHRWYMLLSGAAFYNRASLFTQGADGQWTQFMEAHYKRVR